jgi:hypothetical protein
MKRSVKALAQRYIKASGALTVKKYFVNENLNGKVPPGGASTNRDRRDSTFVAAQ